MCTNFTPTKNAQWVKSLLGVDLPSGFPDESYPSFDAPIVVKSHQTGRVACGLAKFGLIPSWAKEDKIGRHTYNARSETAVDKPSYRGAWRQRQFGLALVDNFFEPSYESGKAVRFRIELATKEPFAIATLWDRWTDPATGERVVSFSMLTVNADQHPITRQFHKPGDEKRTPVIIRPELFEKWLSADQTRAAELMTWSHMADLSAAPAPKN